MNKKFEKLVEIKDIIKSRGKSINNFFSRGKFPPVPMSQEQVKEYLSKNLTWEDYWTPELSLPELRYKLTERIKLRLGYHTTTPNPLSQEKYKMLFKRDNCPPLEITDEVLARISGDLLSNTDFYYIESIEEINSEIDRLTKAG